jgi:glycosyltransferase involved in cell wall biosynthesis
VASIVIPAHNESAVIGRLLDRLADAEPGELDIVVVPNGCTDDTAAIAAAHGARVSPLTSASKAAALRRGDEEARGFPRLYVDADVELGVGDVRALVEALGRPGVLAVAPSRVLDLTGRPWLVRWYYQVWTRLPEVRAGLFGRGVIAVNAEGHPRLARLPAVIADDLAASVAFTAAERLVVAGAKVVIRTPRTTADLMRRRVRSAMGVTQLAEVDEAAGSARTRLTDLVAMARAEPSLIPKLAVFAAIAVIARTWARRTDRSSWHRDDSSRA